jgi:hypothetical protein
MVRRRLLLSAVVAMALTIGLLSASPAAANEVDWVAAQNDDNEDKTDLAAEVPKPVEPPSQVSPPADTNEPLPDTHEPVNVIDVAVGFRPDNCSPEDPVPCAGDPAVEPETPAPAVTVTLRDIASFRPAKPQNTMEPGGWAVEDLPANFVAGASVEIVSGTLLGRPADVRFTPVGYRWTHSDGGLVESSDPGATWESLGAREFTDTSTSHAYAESGEYTVTLEVELRAEYRFAGSGWRSIAGTLTVPGDPQRVLVGEFDTVLTQGDCRAYPAGPGC